MTGVPGIFQVRDGGVRQRVRELLRGGGRQDAVLAAPQHQHRRLREAVRCEQVRMEGRMWVERLQPAVLTQWLRSDQHLPLTLIQN